MKQSIIKTLGVAAAVMGMTHAVGAQEKPSWSWGGDVRTRFDLKQLSGAKFDKAFRLRMRVGAKGQLADGKVEWAVGLATMPQGKSGVTSRNLTLSGGNIGDKNILGIDYAYIGLKPTKRVGLTLGKLKNPFWESDAIFDADVTPEGIAVGVDVYKGDKASTIKNVTNTTMWSPVNESSTVTADAFMLGNQLKADLGPVKTSLAGYFYTGLANNAGASYIGKYTKDHMTVLSLRGAYALPIKRFPITLTISLLDNVAVKAKSLGYEGRLDMPKVGPGALAITARVVNTNATYYAWSDDDFGPAGHKGFRLEYGAPIWKAVTLKGTFFHAEPMKGSGVTQYNRAFIDLSTAF